MNEQLLIEAFKHNQGDALRCQHLLKVYAFSSMIGKLEKLDSKIIEILETAAILHDIAIPYLEKQFGKCHGKLQEKYGPDIAREILNKYNYDQEVIERVCYLIGHHHTYTNIDGLDYQILVEADFLVNLLEDNTNKQGQEAAYNNIFKTNTGKLIFKEMFS